VAPTGRSNRQPHISTTAGLIGSIAVTALAGLGILIVLLLGAFRAQPTSSTSAGAQSPTSSATPSSTASGQAVSPPPSPLEEVVIPTAITVNIAGGNSGLPEWSPILVAVIGVIGAAGSALITYFVQRGHTESSHND
jgi:hypothetical protein